MPIDYVVQPFPVRKLSTEQPIIDCVFGPFEHSVSSVLESYSRDNSEKGRLAFRFFEHLLVTADAKEHREIQIRFLRPDVTPHLDDRVKYIDPVRWFKSKLRLAREQSLMSEDYIHCTPEFSAVPTSDLAERVANLEDQRGTIIDAVDFLVQGF